MKSATILPAQIRRRSYTTPNAPFSMKKLVPLLCLAVASISTTAHAGDTVRSFIIQSADPISDGFIGNSIGWGVQIRDDHRVVSIARQAPYATATDLVLVTSDGLTAYDIAKDGTATPSDDRRIMRNGETLELSPLRVSVLELPSDVTRVDWTRPLSLQIMTVVNHRYLALKYVPLPADMSHLRINGPRRLSITTNSGKYSFDVSTSAGGAPIYRVQDPN